MKNIWIICSFLLFFLAACHSVKENKLPTFDLAKAYQNLGKIDYMDLIDTVTYLPLSNEAPVGRFVLKFYFASSGDIIVVGSPPWSILHFDKEGRFLNRIGNEGKGPEEYINGQEAVITDKYVLLKGSSNNFVLYDYEGNFITSLSLPSLQKPVPLHTLIADRTGLDTATFAGYVFNVGGNDPRKLVVFNKEGEILHVFPNTRISEASNFTSWSGLGVFSDYKDKVYFLENFSDTLYEVTKEELVPRLILDRGEFCPKLTSLNTAADKKKAMFLTYLQETEKYILSYASFYSGREYAYYLFIDKITGKVTCQQWDPKDEFTELIWDNGSFCGGKRDAKEFVSYIDPVDYLRLREEGLIPAKFNHWNPREEDNTALVKIRFK